jgi:hypothetical protein
MSSKLKELRVLCMLLSDDTVLERLALFEKDALVLVAVDDATLFLLSGRGDDHSGSVHFPSDWLLPFDNEDLIEDKYFCMSSSP